MTNGSSRYQPPPPPPPEEDEDPVLLELAPLSLSEPPLEVSDFGTRRSNAAGADFPGTGTDSTLGVLSCYSVIRTLADETTRDVWNGVNSKAARRIPRELWPIVRRKLDQLDAVARLEDLRVPPGNKLHALGGDLRGLYAVRVNDQYRIVFRFEGADVFDVRCTDYH